jgi:hypothetical protein
MNYVHTQDDLNRAFHRAAERTSLATANAALDQFTGGHALGSIDRSCFAAVAAMLDLVGTSPAPADPAPAAAPVKAKAARG